MNRNNKIWNCLVFLVVTVGGVGKIKYAPGTFGSLTAYPFLYLYIKIIFSTIFGSIIAFKTSRGLIAGILVITILYLLFFFLVGLIFTKIYLKDKTDKDPKEVVIDELVGQLLTSILCNKLSFLLIPNVIEQNVVLIIILPFILFRLFDILKPWPINWIDKNMKNALGVMLDDIAAAVLATVMYSAIILIISEKLT